jgi:hypothetical protein
VLFRSHNSVIVTWTGDTTARAYDVYVTGQDTIPVEGTSCGVDGLQHSTPYQWHVRARNGERKTTWVDGPSFTTEFYDDTRDHWVGTWQARDWTGTVILFGSSIPYDEFADYIPAEVDPAAMLQSMEVTIALADNNQITMTLPAFTEPSPIPGGDVTLPIIDQKATIEQSLSGTGAIPVITDPVPVTSLPFFDDIEGAALLNGTSITEFTITPESITITFGPQVADSIPVLVTVNSQVSVHVSDSLLDAMLGLALPDKSLKIRINSALYKKEE